MNKHQIDILLLEIRNMDRSMIGDALVLKHDYINYLLNTMERADFIMSKIFINIVYIEALLNNKLNDFEIIRRYMHYYVAQGRCLHNLPSDLVYQYKKAYFGMKDLEVNQIQAVLIKVKKSILTNLVNQYGIPKDFIASGSDFKVER